MPIPVDRLPSRNVASETDARNARKAGSEPGRACVICKGREARRIPDAMSSSDARRTDAPAASATGTLRPTLSLFLLMVSVVPRQLDAVQEGFQVKAMYYAAEKRVKAHSRVTICRLVSITEGPSCKHAKQLPEPQPSSTHRPVGPVRGCGLDGGQVPGLLADRFRRRAVRCPGIDRERLCQRFRVVQHHAQRPPAGLVASLRAWPGGILFGGSGRHAHRRCRGGHFLARGGRGCLLPRRSASCRRASPWLPPPAPSMP